MKHDKLEVGKEYLMSRDSQWRTRPYATVSKVRLESTTRYRTRYSYGVGGGMVEDENGEYVRVTVMHALELPGRYEKIRDIRAPWDEADAARKALREQKRNEEYEKIQRRKAAEEAAQSLAARAAELGLPVRAELNYHGRFEITPEQLQAFVDRMRAEDIGGMTGSGKNPGSTVDMYGVAVPNAADVADRNASA